jgi:hypothetical protein
MDFEKVCDLFHEGNSVHNVRLSLQTPLRCRTRIFYLAADALSIAATVTTASQTVYAAKRLVKRNQKGSKPA